MLQKYAEEKGFENTKFLFDDGYSGTNFNRPAWNEIMELIETGQVKTLIIKDMSRLGRDYLQIGMLMEHTFPNYNVRLIAINDAVDTLYGDNDFTPFRNLFNDFYAKDISRKINTSLETKQRKGEFIGAFAPYGYKKSPEDKHQLILDEDTAPTVYQIFQWKVQGLGNTTDRKSVV